MIDLEFVRPRASSPLAQLTRLSLIGLQSTLAAALDAMPDDLSAGDVRAVLRALDGLLTHPAVTDAGGNPFDSDDQVPLFDEPGATDEAHAKPVPAAASRDESSLADSARPTCVNLSPPGLRLVELRDQFHADGRLRPSLGTPALTETTDAGLWVELQRALLRVPEPLAREWKAEAVKLARKVGCEPVESGPSVEVVAGPSDELLWPGLSGAVEVRGLRTSTSVPLPVELRVEGADLLDRPLAAIVAVAMSLARRDPKIRHALRKIDDSREVPLIEGDQCERFLREFVDRFCKSAGSVQRPVEHLRHRIDLDEALHSLLFSPVAVENSWWGKLQRRERNSLREVETEARKLVKPVSIRELIGEYNEEIRSNTRGSNDLQVDGGGKSGHVVICLRLFARIGNETLVGRVLYR